MEEIKKSIDELSASSLGGEEKAILENALLRMQRGDLPSAYWILWSFCLGWRFRDRACTELGCKAKEEDRAFENEVFEIAQALCREIRD